MKPTLVIRLSGGVVSVYLDSPVDLNIVVDESGDYRQGMTDVPAYLLQADIDPVEVSASVALILPQKVPSPELT